MATPADEVPQKDIANQDTEDLEDGEIEDDEDEDTQQQQQPSLEKEEDGETNDDDDGNIKNRGTSSEPTAPEEDEDNNSSFGGVGGGRSKRHHHPTGGGGYKKHHKDRKSSRRDRDRERRRAQRELDADEEKKRRLKEKLHALEMQMAADDEDMGIYASGGSPNHDYVDEEDDLEEEAFDSEDGGSSDGGDFRRKRRRNLSPSRESDRKRRRGDERHHRGGRRMQRSDEICKLFMQGKCPKVRCRLYVYSRVKLINVWISQVITIILIYVIYFHCNRARRSACSRTTPSRQRSWSCANSTFLSDAPRKRSVYTCTKAFLVSTSTPECVVSTLQRRASSATSPWKMRPERYYLR